MGAPQNADSSCAFQGATWDDLAPCQTAGTTSNCGKGMFCARWKDPINAARCTCILRNDGRESPMCKKWLDSYLQATTPPIDGILPGPVITTVVTTTVTGTSGPQPVCVCVGTWWRGAMRGGFTGYRIV